VPTYQYACTECGHRFEQVQAFSDSSLTDCPNCAGKLRKVYGSVGVVFKGSGFYRTDSRSGAASAAAGGDKAGGDKSGGDKSDSGSSGESKLAVKDAAAASTGKSGDSGSSSSNTSASSTSSSNGAASSSGKSTSSSKPVPAAKSKS